MNISESVQESNSSKAAASFTSNSNSSFRFRENLKNLLSVYRQHHFNLFAVRGDQTVLHNLITLDVIFRHLCALSNAGPHSGSSGGGGGVAVDAQSC